MITHFRTCLFAIFSLLSLMTYAQQTSHKPAKEFLLYDSKKESIAEEHIIDQGGNLIVSKITNPTLTSFIPTAETKPKAAVIICPGGGYSNLHIQREGFRVAEAFSEQGVAAFVLKNRLPDKGIVDDISFAPLQDAQRAIQIIRENAVEWGIDPDKIGIMGFSAGGHLASSAGVHHDSILVENLHNTSIRPNFMILVYPVISFNEEITHLGTKNRVTGEQADKHIEQFFSNELHVNANTPPTILFHAGDDTLVPVENSLRFYRQLQANNVPAELHLYSRGEHGFPQTPSFTHWFNECIRWMKAESIL